MIWNFFRNLLSPRQGGMEIFGRTDTGRTRSNNEDSFVVLPAGHLMMVADGMGGHKAGEVASRSAIESMVSLTGNASLRKAGDRPEAIRHSLLHALRQTNEQIMTMASENPAYAGMGCTFIVGYVGKGALYTCHVGDVRAYLLTGTGLRQLTNDHTYAAEYARSHSEDLGQSAPSLNLSRNVVSRAIGFPFPEDPDCTTTPVGKGDRILLCSDGLWSMLPDPRLAMILREASTAEEACDRLISEANQAGGKDNITAVVGFV